jgi:hypothetical protein
LNHVGLRRLLCLVGRVRCRARNAAASTSDEVAACTAVPVPSRTQARRSFIASRLPPTHRKRCEQRRAGQRARVTAPLDTASRAGRRRNSRTTRARPPFTPHEAAGGRDTRPRVQCAREARVSLRNIPPPSSPGLASKPALTVMFVARSEAPARSATQSARVRPRSTACHSPIVRCKRRCRAGPAQPRARVSRDR